MILQIISHTPLWVWGLLGALLILGLAQTRSRLVARWQLLALPVVLLMLGLWSMAPGFAAQPLAGLVWLLSLLTFTRLGGSLPRPAAARWLALEQRLQLPGSWLPMLIIMTIFLLRYVFAVAQTLNPEWRGMLAVQAPLALTFGALSGIFLGRALGLLAMTRGHRSSAAAAV
jgi:hypothetical protein